jgi:hypothetical protein
MGLPSEGKKRWCAGCAKGHVGAVNVMGSKKCEDCGLKAPGFGLPMEGKKRWCSACAKAHAGAVDVVSKKCEDCGLTVPNFGLVSEGKRRWCSGCAKAHTGAVDVKVKKCEDCGEKIARFALPSDRRTKRWCGECAPKSLNPGATRRTPAQLKRAQEGGEKKRKVADPPLNISDLCLSLFGVQISLGAGKSL